MTCDYCEELNIKSKTRPLRCKLGFHKHRDFCQHDYSPFCKFCGYEFFEDSQGGYWSKPYGQKHSMENVKK